MQRFALVLCALSTPCLAQQCLTYGDVAIRGVLTRQTFPEQPNYERVASGDRAATYFFVSPGRALCVAAGMHDDEPAEPRVDAVQLVFAAGADGYGPLRPFVSAQVECSGRLFHAFSGHHHSSVLLNGATCRPVDPRNAGSEERR
jgi:hypothetical protein